jgi:general secretion pathway protein N
MRILRGLLWTSLVILAAAAILFWIAPAGLALRLYADRLGPLQLQGVAGSLWEGRAEQLVAFGVALGELEWRFDRISALGGALTGELRLNGSEVRGEARLAREGADTRLDAVHVEFPAPLLAPALDIPALRLLGRVVVDAPFVVLRDGLMRSGHGRAEWRELGVGGAANVRLPGVAINFSPHLDGSVVAEVSDLGGPLAVEGEVVIRDGHFLSETRLRLREPHPQLEEALKFVGQRTPDGGSYLRVEGQLKTVVP